MTQPEIAVLIFLVFLFFPEEMAIICNYIYLHVLLVTANINLFVRSYLLYRKLKSGMKKHGLDIPPFQFTPIEKRQ